MQSIAKQIYEYGVMAFDRGNYDLAIDYFLTVLEEEEDWTCRWQLVLAYQKAKNVNAMRHQLVYVTERCPDADLRRFAQMLLKKMCLQEASADRVAAPPWLEILRAQVEKGPDTLTLLGMN
jgi:hypothetical protein